MPSNPKRQGRAASNSFSREEINAALEILAILSRGGDASIVARQPPAVSLFAKFARMKRAVDTHLQVVR